MPVPLTRTYRGRQQLPLFQSSPVGATNVLQAPALSSSPRPQSIVTPVRPVARRTTPNSGGTITRNGVTTNVAPSAFGSSNLSPTQNSGGTLMRNGITRVVPPSPVSDTSVNSGGTLTKDGVTKVVPATQALTQPAPIDEPADDTDKSQPTSNQPAQNNPLTNDSGSEALPGDQEEIDPAKQMGFSQKGSTVPRGIDASSDGHMGGAGLYAKKFSNSRSADLYGSYVKKLFGDGAA
jgi:predicted component of type VI protein secretion system